LDLGEGELGRERDLSMVRMSELLGGRERERERGLNVVGPLKMVQPSSTGQTGWSDRSDRSSLGHPKFGKEFNYWFVISI